MRFKYPMLEEQYRKLHPMLLAKLAEFEAWAHTEHMQEAVATHILRTRKEQEGIYWGSVMAKRQCTEAEARAEARNRWTWHFVYAAIDLRDYIYTKEQLARVVDWFKRNCVEPQWEFLFHDVGRGNHLHLGIRDRQWADFHKVAAE